MDPASPIRTPERPPQLVLYARPGCHLCEEARSFIVGLLARRAERGLPSAAIVDRDIAADPELERAFLVEIPVLELAGRRLMLATSRARIERFVAEALDPR